MRKSTLKKTTAKQRLMLALPFCLILLAAFFCALPFLINDKVSGHDIAYHYNLITSVLNSFETHSFGSKIFNLIGLDYGYGTGLFYSMIPSTFIALLAKIFGNNIQFAIFFAIFVILTLAGILTFLLIKKITGNVILSFIISLFYITFPYIFVDIYTRFALNEFFITPLLPLIAWALYEFVQTKNFKLFVPLFVIGFSLLILIHAPMTIYITLFALIYLAMNYKSVFNKKAFAYLAISCVLVLLISATFYIPMLVNIKEIDLGRMNLFKLYGTTLTCFDLENHLYLFLIELMLLAIYLVYLVTFILSRKSLTKSEKSIFVLSTVIIFLCSPLCFLWLILDFPPFNMIQFVWRLFLPAGFICCFMLCFVCKKYKLIASPKTSLKLSAIISSSLLCFLILFVAAFTIKSKDTLLEKNMNYKVNSLSSLGGCGINNDYFPNGAGNNTVTQRVNDSIILGGNKDIEQFANYQTLNQFSFIVKNFDEDYVVLKIPHEVCAGIKVFAFYIEEGAKKEEWPYYYDQYFGEKYLQLQLNFKETASPVKIVVDYTDAPELKNYLIQNPFEFFVLNGNNSVAFKNFVRKNSHAYSFDVTTEGAAVIELPTYFYKGYKITLTNDKGTVELSPVHGENGLIQIALEEGGTVEVKFVGNYVLAANLISAFGLCSLVGVCTFLFVKDKKLKKVQNSLKIIKK